MSTTLTTEMVLATAALLAAAGACFCVDRYVARALTSCPRVDRLQLSYALLACSAGMAFSVLTVRFLATVFPI